MGAPPNTVPKLQCYLVQTEKLTIRVFFETSHGKSKSDGLGSVAKNYVPREVAANELIITNG